MASSSEDGVVHPEYLVETDWLEQHLGDSDLRVLDCTVEIIPNPNAVPGKEPPYSIESGQAHFDKEHIPGAGFVDILGDISDKSSPFPFMMPPEQQFVDAMCKYGIGDDTRVVLYGTSTMMPEMWATRFWWMLRSMGFDNAAILNGGWLKWTAEGRPVSAEPCSYAPSRFAARPRPGTFVGKDDVLAAIGDKTVCTLNALMTEQHAGTGGGVYGRVGRVAGSVNVPAASLRNPDDGTYLPADQLRKSFDTVNVADADRIIVYCGGGISATSDAFTLARLGYDNISVYDASMYEWSNDEKLPMETD
jgi:thiosulfate/3-mercaptopyruvate sulfurtransferase